MKKITVLGVTGSIGTQTVDVVKHHREEFEIIAMSAGRNIELLEKNHGFCACSSYLCSK